MKSKEEKKQMKAYYLDIDGTLTTYACRLSKIGFAEKLTYMQEVFDEFKLTFPSRDEIKEGWKNHNVYLNFLLSEEFSRDMIAFILNLNGISLSSIMEEINKESIETPVEWHYAFKEAGGHYYYQIKLLNSNRKTYQMYDVKHDDRKKIPVQFQTELLDKESVDALNLLLDYDKPEVLVITSSWKFNTFYTIDMLKYQGVHIDGITVEAFDGPTALIGNVTRQESIREDAKKRGIGENYRVIDDDITVMNPDFGEQLIPVDNGLKLEDVYKVLGREKEKGKVLKNGN